LFFVIYKVTSERSNVTAFVLLNRFSAPAIMLPSTCTDVMLIQGQWVTLSLGNTKV